MAVIAAAGAGLWFGTRGDDRSPASTAAAPSTATLTTPAPGTTTVTVTTETQPTDDAAAEAPAAQTTTASASAGSRGAGDLGLPTPISRPACDGTGIVVVGNAVNESTRTADISRLLDQYPGSRYLRTDVSCGSLRDRDDNGNVIYAVYRVAGPTRSDVCSLRAELGALATQLGNDAPYGKWLDNTTDPATYLSAADCGQ